MEYLGHLLFSFNGRITRRSWWLGVLVSVIITLVPVVWITISALQIEGGEVDALVPAQLIAEHATLFYALNLALLYVFVAITAKRMQDRGWHGPIIIGVFFVYFLVSAAGLFMQPAPPPELAQDPAALEAFMRSYMEENGGIIAVFTSISFALSIFFVIDSGFLPGLHGANQHGSDPRET
ncbi:MAG: DUF805 domain-containing protein [Pseudomonadota bacterium]